MAGVAVSLTVIWLNILPDAQGHAVLVAAIAAAYLVFTLLDGSARSLVSEITMMVVFVAAAFLVFDSPPWAVAIAIAARIHLPMPIYLHRQIWSGGMVDTIKSASDIATTAKLFCGFSDPTRLTIIVALTDGEQRVSDIVSSLNGTQGNISGHLKCLRDCGLVTGRRAGREVYYRIAHDEVLDLVRSAERLLALTGHHIDLCPNYTTSGA